MIAMPIPVSGIGATAMVANAYRPSEKGKAQGFHDFVLFGTVAASGIRTLAKVDYERNRYNVLIVGFTIAAALVVHAISKSINAGVTGGWRYALALVPGMVVHTGVVVALMT